MKAEVDKLDINKLTSVPNSLNNLKTKVDELNVGKLKTFPVDLNKLSDVVDNKVINNTKFNTVKTKVNNLKKKIPDATTLIHGNQYNNNKQNVEKKMEMLIKKISNAGGLVTTTVLNKRISKVGNKIRNTSSLVTATVLNAKISEVENKIPDDSKYITTHEFNKLTAEHFAARIKQADLVETTILIIN